MFLRSLTLKGFKSFGDTTTLEFEPGVTVVVGPNGSGKSNIVDAVAWVLGAQGPKTLRSARMDDVIFSGTVRRPALGRAEVALTIDNESRLLPIEANEVTVTRTLFRSGDSEYAINGATCRLLDVQELFSDAGVGRQQHVIVGQGQLDQVLLAGAEERRAMIEEAAGVRKFRRRRERAERRLESTAVNLVRLGDLQREVRRELRPLERQADAARRHDGLVAELRTLRAYQAGRELAELRRRAEALDTERAGTEGTLAGLEGKLRLLDELIDTSDATVAARRTGDARLLVSKLEALRHRARGVGNVVAERRRALESSLERDHGRAVEMLQADRIDLLRKLFETDALLAELAPSRDEVVAEEDRLAEDRQAAATGGGEDGAREHEQGADDVARARASAASEMQALAASREALARLSERSTSLASRRSDLQSALAVAERAVVAASEALAAASEESLVLREAAAAAAAERAATDDQSLAEQGRHAAAARVEVLASALEEARARAGVERLAEIEGVLGTLFDLVEIEAGYELAFGAAAESALEAVVMDGTENARAALEVLRQAGGGGAVIPAEARPPADPSITGVGDQLRQHVKSSLAQVGGLLDVLLGGVVCCSDLEAAIGLVLADPRRAVVTLSGERLAPHGWRVGTGASSATRAALDQARAAAVAAAERADWTAASLRDAVVAAAAARGAAELSEREVGKVEAALAAAQERATELESELSAHAALLEATASDQAVCEERTLAHEKRLLELEDSLADFERFEAARSERIAADQHLQRVLDERARALAEARAELEVKSAGLEERRTMIAGRLAEIDDRIEAQKAEREAAAARLARIEESRLALDRIAGSVATLIQRLGGALAHASAEAERQAHVADQSSAQVATARRERAELEKELGDVRERERRRQLDEAEVRLRTESAVEALARDLDMQPEDALASPRPELPAGVSPGARQRELDRELRLLGPVNPLAEQELQALVERSSFLDRELEDVRSARRELGRLIRAIDSEIAGVFEAAFADVSGHFESLVATLFPGGSGRLSLTPAESPLDMGVEIEARPPGRQMRRLSLLSGGERSLVALAFLFAIFRSRPSPFYLLDEVEAALDDINLHRFLDLLDEFRAEAQLIIVSHQKRTMEAADALYGVTMAPGGTSKVLSERVSRTQT